MSGALCRQQQVSGWVPPPLLRVTAAALSYRRSRVSPAGTVSRCGSVSGAEVRVVSGEPETRLSYPFPDSILPGEVQ
jgi:hypothetical protein